MMNGEWKRRGQFLKTRPIEMSIICGDETGLVKKVNASTKKCEILYDKQERNGAVIAMCWMIQDQQFALLRKNSTLEIWEFVDNTFVISRSLHIDIENPCGIVLLNPEQCLCYGENGVCKVIPITLECDTSNIAMVVRSPLSTCLYSSNIASFGGRENDIEQWDMNTNAVIWSAKNVPHDKLSLRVPIWITALDFLTLDKNPNQIVSGTGYKHVRIYDTRVKRQPMLSMDIGDFRVTSVKTLRENNVYVSDCAGGLQLWDIRACRRMHTLRGSSGSIRCIDLDVSRSRICTVSLDRYVCQYDCKTQKSVLSAYIKNRLNCCISMDFRGSNDDDSADGDTSDIYDEDDDESDNSSDAGSSVSDNDVKNKSSNKRNRHKDVVEELDISSESEDNDVEDNDNDDDNAVNNSKTQISANTSNKVKLIKKPLKSSSFKKRK
jgi:ribosome biogenesis protein NSA1